MNQFRWIITSKLTFWIYFFPHSHHYTDTQSLIVFVMLNTPTTFTVNIPALIWFKTCYFKVSPPNQRSMIQMVPGAWLSGKTIPHEMLDCDPNMVARGYCTGQLLLLNPPRPHSWMTKGLGPSHSQHQPQAKASISLDTFRVTKCHLSGFTGDC